ncbi:hypothetical protein AAMO2058_001550800 [Amorphochlora amoebiformis]
MTTPRLPESTRCVSATLSLAQQLQGGWHQGKSEEYVRSTETEGFVGESRFKTVTNARLRDLLPS